MDVTVAEMKANLSNVLRKAAAGAEVQVTRHGKPYVRLGPARPERPTLPRVGAFDGQFQVPDNWDDIATGFEPYIE